MLLGMDWFPILGNRIRINNLFPRVPSGEMEITMLSATILIGVVEIPIKLNSLCSNIDGPKWRSGDHNSGGAKMRSNPPCPLCLGGTLPDPSVGPPIVLQVGAPEFVLMLDINSAVNKIYEFSTYNIYFSICTYASSSFNFHLLLNLDIWYYYIFQSQYRH